MKNPIIILLLLSTLSMGCTDKDELSVRFPIPVVEAGQAPFYAALDQGYYEQEGLTVRFEHGTSELNPVKMVSLGVDDFGLLGGPDTLLVARGQGQNLTAVSVFHEDANFVALYTLQDSGLTKLSDLEDKKVGFFFGHISTDILRSTFSQNGISAIEVGVPIYDYSQLISGQIHAETGFKQTTLPNLEEIGVEVNVIDPADYGISSHGYTLFVKDEMISQNPDLVEKFVRATLRGLQYSVHYPEEAIDIMAKYDSQLRKHVELKRIPYYNEKTSTAPYGKIDHEMFEETYDRLFSLGLIEHGFDVSDAYDTQFIERIGLEE